jgi:hypothetical protein
MKRFRPYVSPYYRKLKRREYDAAKVRRNRDIIMRAKDRPCADCGVQYEPRDMEFDHVRGVKLFTLGGHGTKVCRNGRVVRICAVTVGLRMLYAEIAKCEVVCRPCHQRRTAYRKRNGNGGGGNDPSLALPDQQLSLWDDATL